MDWIKVAQDKENGGLFEHGNERFGSVKGG
jgi:hypothetical protein